MKPRELPPVPLHQLEANTPTAQLERDYYLHEWGRPIITEHGLFERICLGAFHAGMAVGPVLARRRDFRRRFFMFDPTRVLAMSEEERTAALADDSLICDPDKLSAIFTNAAATVQLRKEDKLQHLPLNHPARTILGGAADRLSPGLPVLVWSFVPAEHRQPRSVEEIPDSSPVAEELSAELQRRGFTFTDPRRVYALMQSAGLVNDHVLAET